MVEQRATTILLVDDDAVNRQLLGLLFRDAGYTILEAGTGKEALALASSCPDVIVLDVNLPDQTGFEVRRQLRERLPTNQAAIVHLSAVYVESGDRSLALEEGADAYLVKPVEPRELLATIKAVLRIRAAEEAARAAAQQWRATFDAIADGICLLDKGGCIIRCNRALCQFVGRSFNDLVGQGLHEVLQQGLGLEQPPGLPRLDQIHDQETLEQQLGTRWFRLVVNPMPDEDHRGGCVVILTDITQQKELEEQLRQAAKLEAIGRLAGGIAHEFNNQLTVILGNTSLLSRNISPGEPSRELLTIIERSAWRAAELTRQLLGFSRQTLLWLTPTDLNAILRQAAEELQPLVAPAIALEVSAAPNLWPVQADPALIQQILVNLGLNARDAMPSGGRLVLTSSNIMVTEEQAQRNIDARPGPFARLSVQDTGNGISAELRCHIFDPFFTTKPAGTGTGLGLAMVHGIVKQHQGWVECHSEPGLGTRFDLYLPWTREASDSITVPSTTASPGSHRLILFADDNDTLRSLAASYLRQGGFEVLLANNGREAVALYQRHHPRIDLVILDQMMPHLTGSDARDEIHRINPAARVLLAGVVGTSDLPLVIKPYREHDLLQAVHQALDSA